MAKTDIKVPMSHVVRRMRLTVKMTGMRTFSARLWLGTKLIQLAAIVIGCGVQIVNGVEVNG